MHRIFIDCHTASIIRKTKIALFEPIIEDIEWEHNCVKIDELDTYLSNKCDPSSNCKVCQIIPDIIKLIPSDMYDLFLEESSDNNIEIFIKYIPVQTNHTYQINQVETV